MKKHYRHCYTFPFYFLGNMKIHRITQDGTHELSIHLKDWNGNQRQANYSQFSVGPGKLYTFSASGYSGEAGICN